MNNQNKFERSDVQHFISYLESIINRMTSNSANCKNWLLAIMAGCMAMQPTMKDVVDKIWLAYPLVVLFCILDAYYLGCEKYFRDMVRDFANEVRKEDNQYVSSLYKFRERKVCDDVVSILSGFCSIATWPFYGTLIVLVYLIDKGIISLV